MSFLLFFSVRRKRGPHRQPSCVIYTWLQVNGVSVADPSHSDLYDLLFILMSTPLVSFFLLFSLLSLSFHLSSLSWKRKKKHAPPPVFPIKQVLSPSLPLSLSLSHLPFFFFFSHTHPHTILSVGKQRPIQPVAFTPLSGFRRSITWFDGSYYRPGFPGQEAGIFIAADTGSFQNFTSSRGGR